MEVRRALSKFVCLCALPMASVMPQDALRQRPAIAGDSPLQNHANTVQVFPNFAQTLTDEMLKEHPDVLVIAFHVQIPGESINRVVAINQAQWGKFQWRPSDDIDTDTARTRKTIVQVIPATHRMEVHMPLHTKSGETIATFVCVWNFREEEEAPELMRKSQAIRNEIAARISSVEQLLGTP
jgi:hypothetical protein